MQQDYEHDKNIVRNAFIDFLPEKDRKMENVTEDFITDHMENKFNAIVRHYKLYGNSFSKRY